jgi:hypothetical protein
MDHHKEAETAMINSLSLGKLLVSMLMVLTLTLMPVLLQPTRAEVTDNFWAPFDFTFTDDPCLGSARVVGRFHFLFKTEGEGRDSQHVNLKGTAQSLTNDDTFVFSRTYNDQCTFDDECNFTDESIVLDVVVKETWIGKGPAPNLIFHIQRRETFDDTIVKNLVIKCQ